MKQSSKLFSAFLLGAATGALMSPEKGSVLRKKVAKNTAKLIDQLQDTIENPKGKLNDLKAQLIEKANELKEEFSEEREKSKSRRKEPKVRKEKS
ncbi:MAG: YtxH domain-containing protein [Bacteroidetes bacterium]|nr:YtxH domain-containing protein [Bacteroidota bacterium]